jgi:hypothetical protein
MTAVAWYGQLVSSQRSRRERVGVLPVRYSRFMLWIMRSCMVSIVRGPIRVGAFR